MAYATISMWKFTTDQNMDAIADVMQGKYMPAIKAFGAKQAFAVQTGPDTSAVISVFPDEATRNYAMVKIRELRSQASTEFAAEMTGELKGEVMAST